MKENLKTPTPACSTPIVVGGFIVGRSANMPFQLHRGRPMQDFQKTCRKPPRKSWAEEHTVDDTRRRWIEYFRFVSLPAPWKVRGRLAEDQRKISAKGLDGKARHRGHQLWCNKSDLHTACDMKGATTIRTNVVTAHQGY